MCKNSRVSDLNRVSTPLGEDELLAAAGIIAAGGLLVTPTDTVYGIGAKATDVAAVRSLLAAKGRGRQMPPPVVTNNLAQLNGIVCDISPWVTALTELFWPGALTLVLPAAPEFVSVLGDLQTLAVRVPDNKDLLALLEKTGPLALTSANLTGYPAAMTCDQAMGYFASEVNLYIDGGTLRGGVPSTIVDVARPVPKLLRAGAISADQIDAVLQTFDLRLDRSSC